MLRKNSTLVSLSLGSCKIGDEGAEAICKALAENATLLKLNMNNNSGDIAQKTKDEFLRLTMDRNGNFTI